MTTITIHHILPLAVQPFNEATMIRDTSITVRTDKQTYEIVITGDQIRKTVLRRMQTLAPKERILDMVENVPEVAQPDSSKAGNGKR